MLCGCSKNIDLISKNGGVAPATDAITKTVAELRNLEVAGNTRYFSSDYGGGTWVLDNLDDTSADNTGTVLVNKFEQRLKRITAISLNSLWFGLKGDGSDETAILQKAINASAGHILLLPTGTFFTSQLTLVSNITITGNNTKLRMIQGAYDNTMIKLSGLIRVKISGLEIALNGISGDIWDGTSVMQLQNCNNVGIDHCFIHDNTYVGIRLIGGNNNITINNNTIENTDTGIHANNTNKNIKIISNIITNGTSEGITVYGYSPTNIPSSFLIDSNIIRDKLNSFGINIPYAKFGTITHNTIQNCLGGITLHDVVSVGSEGHYTTDMIIKNNYISNTNFGIIYVGDRTVVANNTITAVQQDGINANNYDDAAIMSTGVAISDNVVTGAGQAGGGRGGISVKNLLNSTVAGNSISNCGSAFAIRFNGDCNGLTLSNNSCPDGMLQTTNTVFAQNVSVTNNMFSNTYFPVAYPLNYKFMLVTQGTKYTCDTTFNTAPDNNGLYSDINSFCVRTSYHLAGGSINSLAPSWTGRTIILYSTNQVSLKQANNIHLKNGLDITVPANKCITLTFDGSFWNEAKRDF